LSRILLLGGREAALDTCRHRWRDHLGWSVQPVNVLFSATDARRCSCVCGWTGARLSASPCRRFDEPGGTVRQAGCSKAQRGDVSRCCAGRRASAGASTLLPKL